MLSKLDRAVTGAIWGGVLLAALLFALAALVGLLGSADTGPFDEPGEVLFRSVVVAGLAQLVMFVSEMRTKGEGR